MRSLVSGPVSSQYLLAHLAEACILRRIVHVRSSAVENPARTEHSVELRVLRILGILRLLLGVHVVEIAEELVESVDCR
jgi:hypothetical protein